MVEELYTIINIIVPHPKNRPREDWEWISTNNECRDPRVSIESEKSQNDIPAIIGYFEVYSWSVEERRQLAK